MKKDIFPDTLKTWIERKLLEGDAGRGAVNCHVMEIYSVPLGVYCRGIPARDLGDPEDLVRGFFSDRLDREDFFENWQSSDLRLRRWLMNAFAFYLKEQRRKKIRDQRLQPLEIDPLGSTEETDKAIDKAFAISIVRKALADARDVCAAKGLHQHWEIFYRHYYEGLNYKDFIDEYGVTSLRAAEMARSAASRFRRSLRLTIASDGARESEIDDEIESFLDATA